MRGRWRRTGSGSRARSEDVELQARAKSQNRALTKREQQVCSLVAKGFSNKAIAWELHITYGSVKEYLFRIFRKIGCANRTELAIYEIRRAG
jgi:DNA-binding NarL/FixJ family response regulator